MDIIKICGIAIVLAACSMIGIAAGEKQKEHINMLMSLKRCLLTVKGEIAYAYTPLSEIFSLLSGMGSESWSVFFARILDELADRSQDDMSNLSQIWERVCRKSEVCADMRQDELDELVRFGSVLGTSDRDSQISRIELYIENIDDRINYLQKHIYEKVRLCHVLGVSAGLLITILIV